MIGKESLLKALGITGLCLLVGFLCTLAPEQRPFMKSFFSLASLLFFGAAAITLPSLSKNSLYWGMTTLWTTLQAFIFFSWVLEVPFITKLAWAVTPITYTTLASLIIAMIHKFPVLTPRQRMLYIMSLFLGSMYLLLDNPYALKSIIIYFIAFVIFPVNVYELFHEPSESGSRLGHQVTTTLLGSMIAFYLIDSIGTIIIAVNRLEYQSLYHLLTDSVGTKGTTLGVYYPRIAETLAYSSVFISSLLLIYIIWAVLPRACCVRHSHEDIF